MTPGVILLLLLIGLLLGALPAWPYSRSWGYAPTGFFFVICIILIVFVLLGHI